MSPAESTTHSPTNSTTGLEISSSVVVVKALGLEPEGVPTAATGICAMCGLQLNPGDLRAPAQYTQSFTDDLSLAARGSPCMCGYCVRLNTVDALRASGFGVFSKAGTAPFRKWKDVAQALMEPPEPPFVMTYATANNQHMGWRSPVNHSRDVFMVRVGLRDLRIRRQVLDQAVKACELLGTLPGVKSKNPSAARKTLANPFVAMSPDLKEPSHGRLHPGLHSEEAKAAWTPKHTEALTLVKALTMGESWALRFILTPGAGSE